MEKKKSDRERYINRETLERKSDRERKRKKKIGTER